ncbi:MAG: dTMP kinase [Streptosporangiales bacterium]|nr:dTMP kinase [Streptosporangiales bacterium]
MTRTGRAAAKRERHVLANTSFRRLWISLSLSSLGDWLSFLALTALASQFTASAGYTAQSFAVGGVLILKVAPAVVLGPLAGAVADRFDRRKTLVIGDLLRFAIYASIPLVGTLSSNTATALTWLLIATPLAECVALFWMPAKDAAVPNLVPKGKLEQANQLSLLTTYGTAPIAAMLFSLLAIASGGLARIVPFFKTNPADLALYINALTFLIAALVIWNLKEISRPGSESTISVPSVLKQIVEGWRFVGATPVVRGLVIGILGAFAAGGAVVGVAQRYATTTLGGGDAAWGVLFGSVFTGMAIGMFLGPRILRDFSRRRLFGLAIVCAGIAMVLIGLVPNMVIVAILTAVVGGCAGVAWVIGYTLIGLEVDDDIRGRTFAFVQSMARVVLLLVLAVVPFVVGLIGEHPFPITDKVTFRLDGTNAVMLGGALLAIFVGIVAYRQMDDRAGVPLVKDLLAAVRGVPYVAEGPEPEVGLFIAFEGGEGAGKTTQCRLLAIWLRELGFDVVTTQEPGATKAGMRLRGILLDRNHAGLSPRAEALMYAADRAEHVDKVIKPALGRGSVVITDRYVDSSLAYQGAGRDLPLEDIARLNRWATDTLTPDLTILLDVPASVGLKYASPDDRLESEPMEFHERVRRAFRALADLEPHRYLVIDGTQTIDEISTAIQDRVALLVPDPVPTSAEDITGTFPAIRE